jgi:hypothetical protein
LTSSQSCLVWTTWRSLTQKRKKDFFKWNFWFSSGIRQMELFNPGRPRSLGLWVGKIKMKIKQMVKKKLKKKIT